MLQIFKIGQKPIPSNTIASLKPSNFYDLIIIANLYPDLIVTMGYLKKSVMNPSRIKIYSLRTAEHRIWIRSQTSPLHYGKSVGMWWFFGVLVFRPPLVPAYWWGGFRVMVIIKEKQ